jgi:hypothetical protein
MLYVGRGLPVLGVSFIFLFMSDLFPMQHSDFATWSTVFDITVLYV